MTEIQKYKTEKLGGDRFEERGTGPSPPKLPRSLEINWLRMTSMGWSVTRVKSKVRNPNFEFIDLK